MVARNRVYRRLAAAVMVIGLLFSLAACAEPQETEKPAYKGEISLWIAPGLASHPAGGHPSQEWFDERVKAYQQANKSISVQPKVFRTPQELEAALTAAADAGAPAPDLAFGRFLPALAPRLANVEPELGKAKDDYLPGALRAFRHGETLHGVPALMEVQVLALNEKAFADAGVALPADGRWTDADFEASLNKLSGPGRFGLGFYHLPGYHQWYPLASGVFTQDGVIADGAQAGLERLNRFRQENLLHPDTGKVKAEEIWQRFARGEIAVMPVGAWAIPLLRSEPYNVKLAVAGFPGDLTVGYTYGFSVFRQQDPLKVKAAVDLAQFLAAPDQQVRLARETGLMPARKSAPNPFEQDPPLTRAFALRATQQPLPAGPAWEKAEAPVSQQLLYALLGGRKPQAALEEIRKLLPSASTSGAR